MWKYFVISLVCFAVVLGRSFPDHLPAKEFPHGSRVVGGYEINITEAPWQVGIEEFGILSCGGSIINENWVLTAAHCLAGTFVAVLSVRAGSTERGHGGVLLNVVEGDYHENFSYVSYDNDVAVLRVDPPFVFDEFIQPIPLADVEPVEGANATVTGWGAEFSGDLFLPRILHEAIVPIYNREACNEAYSGGITPRMICAGYPEGGIDTCQGDSGGPLVVDGVLSGASSWGQGCALAGYPGVYTNIASLRSWIDPRVNG